MLVVGDIVLDEYVYGEAQRVSREAPVVIVNYERTDRRPGGAANVAANAAAWTKQVKIVGAVGRDESGRRVRTLLQQAGVRVVHEASRSVDTEVKTRVMVGSRGTSRQQVVRVDRAHQTPLPVALRRALATAVTREARNADVVLVSDYGGGVCDAEVREALTKVKVPVVVDSRYSLRSFVGAYACKPNEPELEAIVGRPIVTDFDLREALIRTQSWLGCEVVVATRGNRGMAFFERASRAFTRIAAHGTAEAVDVTGAGDTVLAMLGLGIGARQSVPDVARLANIAASIVVQRRGAATATPAEVRSAARLPRQSRRSR